MRESNPSIERGPKEELEKEFVVEKDRKFIDWLQERISSPVLQRKQELLKQKQKLEDQTDLAAIEKELFETEKIEKYVSSDGFRKELANWEPWRLNEKSVETGNNLYIRVAKGYARESFLNWTKEEAEKYHTDQNQILAGIIEAVRNTEWETMKVMAAKNAATEHTLPHLVIGKSPITDIALFQKSLEEAKKKAPEKRIAGLFSEEEAELQVGLAMIIATMPYRLRQALAESRGEGILSIGSSSENIIGIYDKRLEELFDSEVNRRRKKEKIQETVVEEEVHHQRYKDSEIKNAKSDWLKHHDILKESLATEVVG